MTTEITTPQQLAALLEGKSDDEIQKVFAEVGVDEALDRIFSAMAERFLPEKAGGRNAVVQWEIATADGSRAYQVKVQGGTCSAGRGATETANVTLQMALPDFLRLITGKLNGVQAFMAGKLKVTGDIMLAQAQQSWFEMA